MWEFIQERNSFLRPSLVGKKMVFLNQSHFSQGDFTCLWATGSYGTVFLNKCFISLIIGFIIGRATKLINESIYILLRHHLNIFYNNLLGRVLNRLRNIELVRWLYIPSATRSVATQKRKVLNLIVSLHPPTPLLYKVDNKTHSHTEWEFFSSGRPLPFLRITAFTVILSWKVLVDKKFESEFAKFSLIRKHRNIYFITFYFTIIFTTNRQADHFVSMLEIMFL